MPFVKKIETDAGILGIWKLTESSEELLQNFQFLDIEKTEFIKIKFERRKKEYLSVRKLLGELLNCKPEISYVKSGKPYLKNHSYNLSISHSPELVTILLSKENVGIDVENTSRSVEKIANRFLHENELDFLNRKTNHPFAKTIYWGAKEAIFKCTKREAIQFNTQIFIHPIEIKTEGTLNGTLQMEEKREDFKLWYFLFENNAIVYCVEEKNKKL